VRFLKILFIVVLVVVLAKYFPVFYYSSQFNEIVAKETAHMKTVSQLRAALYEQAEQMFIPLQPSDVKIKENGADVKVNVDYEVPVNLLVYKHYLTFHAAASGTIPDYR
jgi:hypothetical protein